MSIAFRAITQDDVGGIGTTTINRPAGVAPGDVMVAVICFTGGDSLSAQVPAFHDPDGWRLIGETDRVAANSLSVQIIRTLVRVAGSGEPASYTWTTSTPNDSQNQAYGEIGAWSGVDNASPLDTGFLSAGATSATSLATPAVTTVTDHAWVLSVISAGLFVNGVPGNMTNRNKGAALGHGTSDAEVTPAGLFTPNAWTFSSATLLAGHTIVLRPAAGPPLIVYGDAGQRIHTRPPFVGRTGPPAGAFIASVPPPTPPPDLVHPWPQPPIPAIPAGSQPGVTIAAWASGVIAGFPFTRWPQPPVGPIVPAGQPVTTAAMIVDQGQPPPVTLDVALRTWPQPVPMIQPTVAWVPTSIPWGALEAPTTVPADGGDGARAEWLRRVLAGQDRERRRRRRLGLYELGWPDEGLLH